MDNRVFNVNGSGLEMLTATLELAFHQEGENTKAKGYLFDPQHGLILLWYLDQRNDDPQPHKFLVPLSAELAAPMVFEWLQSEEAKKMKSIDRWDEDTNHDGHNTCGWRVYCEKWGHVGKYRNTIVAITPAFMWHGK
jgi:hypothetical protein